MTSLSVGHVLWTGEVGGIERLVHDLAREQAAQGLRVTVAMGQPRGPFASRMRAAGLDIVDLGLRSGYDLMPLRIRRAARALQASEVVHLHAFNLPLGSAVLHARRPVVFTEHGNFGTGRERTRAATLKQRLQGRFLRHSVAALAANSRFTAERLAAIHGIDLDDVAIVHNGVVAPAGGPGAPNPRDGVLRVLFVGRLARVKRVERLLDGAAATPNAHVQIVGGGPLESELRELATQLKIADRVDFLGYRDDVDDLLDRADVLVQPTAGEAFGLAVVEAAAHGVLPVVFADGGGALEVLPPDGRVAESPAALAAIFKELLGSPALSPSARRERAEWASSHFSIERCAREYLDLYRSVLP